MALTITPASSPKATSTSLGTIQLGSDTVQSVAANAVSTTASRSYAIQLNSSDQAVVNVPWEDTDVNWFPTTFTWTGGTTAGPTGSLTGSGMSAVSYAAIPAATGSASGIVTTTTQTFAGAKTLSSTTASSSTTTGALIVSGGVGVAGQVTANNFVASTQFLAPLADSVTVPGHSWSGDENTGMYRSGVDSLSLTANGVEQVRVTEGIVRPFGQLLMGSNTAGNTAWVRKYAGGYSSTHTPSVPHRIGQITFAYASEHMAVVGQIRLTGGGVVGIVDFTMQLRSNTLPSKSYTFEKISTSAGLVADVQLYEDTASGLFVITYSSASSIQSVSWDISISERGNYNYWQQVSTVTSQTLTGLTDRAVTVTPKTFSGVVGVPLGTAALPGLFFSGDPNTGIFSPAADFIGFSTGGGEVARFTDTNKFLIGHTPQFTHGNTNARVQIGGTTNADASMTIARYAADTSGGILHIGKGRAGLGVATTAVASGDVLGNIIFTGSNTVEFSAGATIRAVTTQTWTTGARGTQLEFLTASNGSTTSTLRMTVADTVTITGPISAGAGVSTSGSVLLTGNYSPGAITVFGTEFSNGGPVLGYAVTPSLAAAGAFLSSTSINCSKAALTMVGNVLIYRNAAASAVTIGNAVTLTERLRINADGYVGIGRAVPVNPLSLPYGTYIGWGTDSVSELVGIKGDSNSTLSVYAGGVDKLVVGASTATFGVSVTVNSTLAVGWDAGASAGAISCSNWFRPASGTGMYWSVSDTGIKNPAGSYGSVGTYGALNSYAGYEANGQSRICFMAHTGASTRGIYQETSTAAWLLQYDASNNATFPQNVTAYSDRRLKKDIEPIRNALSKLMAITGVTFTRIDSGERGIGVIAQDVQEVFPEVVVETKPKIDSEDTILTVAYGNLMGPVIEALREINERLTALEARVKQ